MLSVPYDVADEVYTAAQAKNEAERHKAIANANGTADTLHLRDRLISLGAIIEG